MFHTDITFILALIALSMGVGILLKAKKYREMGVKGCQFLGYLVVILSLLMLLTSGFCLVKHVVYRHLFCKGEYQMMMQNKMPMDNKNMPMQQNQLPAKQ